MGRSRSATRVEADETVVEISTDKVDMELPAPAAGTITEILAEEGETVTVGQVIARMQVGAAGAKKADADDGNGAATASAPRSAPPQVPKDVKATPVAQRVAAAEGVDLSTVQGTGPGGRITKDDVLERAATARAAPRRAARGAQLIKGGAAMLARYMDESRSIPTATSFRTITVTTMDGRRKELKNAGQKVSFTHLIAYAIALRRPAGHAGDGAPLRGARRQAAPHRRRRRQPRHRRRRRKEGRQPHADGPGHPRRGPHVVHRVQGRVRRAHRQGARQQAHRRRPHRREHLAHQPGRHRHDRLGPAAHDRPGHDRRDRLDRLPGRPRQHRRA